MTHFFFLLSILILRSSTLGARVFVVFCYHSALIFHEKGPSRTFCSISSNQIGFLPVALLNLHFLSWPHVRSSELVTSRSCSSTMIPIFFHCKNFELLC